MRSTPAVCQHGTIGVQELGIRLDLTVVWKGGGAGFEPMTCSVEVLRFRASHQCCTEAMSEVGCNSSPILLGKLLDIKIILKLLCIECKFSDLGTIVIL